MYLAVAVGATPVKEERRVLSPRGYWMLRVTMTLGAQSWVGNFEQAVVHGAMGFVAVGAGFPNRWMFVQKGTAPFRMTGVAVLVDTRLFELRRIRRSVRIMAVRTCQRAFSYRHVGRALQLGLSLQVTLAAHFRLSPFVKKNCSVAHFRQLVTIRSLFHERMAVDTRHAATRVRARFPICLHSTLMAAQAYFVFYLS